MRRIRLALGPLLVMLLTVAVTVLLGRTVLTLPPVTALDLRLLEAVNGTAPPAGIAVARVIDVVGAPPVSWLVALLGLAAVGVARRSARAALRSGVALAAGSWLVSLVKLIVQRGRPEPALLAHHPIPTPTSSSFPSGHTAYAAALGVALVLAVEPGPRRRTAGAIAAVVVVLTAWSRLALGVHFPADVLASALLVPVVGVCAARAVDALSGPPPAAGAPGGSAGRAQPPSDPPRPAGAGPEPTSPNRARPNMVSFAPTPGRIANSPEAVCWRYSLMASERVIFSRIG